MGSHLYLVLPAETSLSQIADVQERLHQNELALRKEIVELEADLQREQNPQKMQAIQEMIGVSGE
jgi:hypothetical protein